MARYEAEQRAAEKRVREEQAAAEAGQRLLETYKQQRQTA